MFFLCCLFFLVVLKRNEANSLKDRQNGKFTKNISHNINKNLQNAGQQPHSIKFQNFLKIQ